MVLIHVCDITVSMKKKTQIWSVAPRGGGKRERRIGTSIHAAPTDLINKLNSVSANEIEIYFSLSSSDFFPVSFDKT